MDAKIVGRHIRKFREEKKITQKEMAKLLFVSDKTISRWELGKGLPDIDELPVLASLLGISIDDLVGEPPVAPETATDNGGRKAKKRLPAIVAAAAGLAAVLTALLLTLSAFGVFGRREKNFVFEAEFADFSGEYRIERTAKASGGACAAWLHTAGDRLTFELSADRNADAVLGIMLNRPAPFVFEDKLLLYVNGEPKTLGSITGTGQDGTAETFFYSFSEPIKTDVRLRAGENVVTLTVVDGISLNIDYVSLTTEAQVGWRQTPFVCEAEKAAVSGLYSIEETPKASGGKCVGWLNTPGETVTFDLTSDTGCEARLDIFINRPEDFVFEDAFALTVNGTPLTIGEVAGLGEDGSNDGRYYCFGLPVSVTAGLVKGDNRIELTTAAGTNLDCIVVKAAAAIAWKT